MERSTVDAAGMTAAGSARKPCKDGAVLWERFIETGRIEDYLSFSIARASADPRQRDHNG